MDTDWLNARADALWKERQASKAPGTPAAAMLGEQLSLEVVRLPGSESAVEAEALAASGAVGDTAAAAQVAATEEAAAAGGRLLARFAQSSRPDFLLGRPRRVPQGVELPQLPPLVRVLLHEAGRATRRFEVLDAAEWEAVLRCDQAREAAEQLASDAAAALAEEQEDQLSPLADFGARLEACRLQAQERYGRDGARWASTAAYGAASAMLDRELTARELRLTRNHLAKLQVAPRHRYDAECGWLRG